MRNLKITKILLSLMLMFGLTTSSFAMSHHGKEDKGKNKPKVEQKIQKHDTKIVKKHHSNNNVKVVKIYNDSHHKHHHHKHHDKVVYYSCNNGSDFAAKCIGTGLCLAMIAAINS